MADPLSIGASVLAIVTAAVQSTRTLCETVRRYRGRDKTLGRLQDELEEMASILISLSEVISGEDSMCCLLRDPVDRCSRLCLDFERSMKQFIDRPKANFLDWAKLEFKRGNINEFIDTLSGYKSTIAVGLGIMKMSVQSTPTSYVLTSFVVNPRKLPPSFYKSITNSYRPHLITSKSTYNASTKNYHYLRRRRCLLL